MSRVNEKDLVAQEMAAEEAAAPTVAQVNEELNFEAEEMANEAIQKTYDEGVATSNPGSFKRKQLESLKSFFDSPVSYGAVVGQALAGIVGGSAAGAAATPIAMGFNQMANQRYLQNQLISSRESIAAANASRKTQQDPKLNQNLIHADTGETLAVVGGKVVDQEGKPVPVNKQKNLLDTRETRLEDQGNERIDISKFTADTGRKSYELRAEEAKDLSPKQFDSVTGARQALESIDKIDALFKDTSVGPIIGRVKKISEIAGLNEEAFTAISQEIAFTVQGYQKAISGLTVTEGERKFLENNLPKITDSPKVFTTKSKGFRNMLEKLERRTIKDAAELQGRGPGIKEETKASDPLDGMRAYILEDMKKPANQRHPNFNRILKDFKDKGGKL